jgi:glycosyltransferase involved in cell wall biosynthesis
MSLKHDFVDWLGGYPYEYATPEEIVCYVGSLGFTLSKIQTVSSIGCNEYVFIKNKPVENLPGVTVLLSVHNSAKTLDKALKSVFSQTLQPTVVCVNDASTDATSDILAKWQQKIGQSLQVIVNDKNIGLTQSLNKGLRSIKTPYTARIDADDWWEPTKLEKQVNFLEANPDFGVIGCWYTNWGQYKKHYHKPFMTDASIRAIMINQNPFAHSCVVFKTKLIQRLSGYDETVRYGQDYELWLRCLPRTKFFNFPQNLCHRSFIGGISIEKQHDQMYYALKTRLKYIRLYRLPWVSYLSLVEPWMVRLTPRWLADLKRHL